MMLQREIRIKPQVFEVQKVQRGSATELGDSRPHGGALYSGSPWGEVLGLMKGPFSLGSLPQKISLVTCRDCCHFQS